MQIASESWDDIWPEAEPMFAAHAAEVEPGRKSGTYVLNSALASAMSRTGGMPIWTARESGILVGYCIWYLGPSFDSIVPTATQGPWYVKPEWRSSRAGLRVFKESLAGLKALGVKRVLPHHWVGGGGVRLGNYFESLGAKPLEVSYSLWLDEVK